MIGVTHVRTLLIVLLCCFSFAAQATTINLFASLDGSQEVPANASLGTGTALISFDDVSNMLSWDITFSGLSGPVIGAHFHGPAAAGVNAGVQVNIGNISGFTSPMIGSTAITDAQEADLLAGLWYINLHTDLYPGGEIRGQVSVVPVPAAFWLMTSGLLGLLGVSRRRSRV